MKRLLPVGNGPEHGYHQPRYKKLFIGTLGLTLALLAVLVHNNWSSYRYFRQTIPMESSLAETIGIIAQLDESLTMSVRLVAATGDLQWEQRYLTLEPQLEVAIQRAKRLAPDLFIGATAQHINQANLALVKIEKQALALVRQGHPSEAAALLASPEYTADKQAYSNGFQKIRTALHERNREHLSTKQREFYMSLVITGALLPVLLLAWFVVLKEIRKHDTERKLAEIELEHHRDQLEGLVEKRTSELVLARDAAEAANRAKSTFLANMSHEIRTPMNAVLGFAQLLERDASLSPTARDRVTTIMKSGQHLLGIINDILEISRIEAGKVEVRNESVDLHSLLGDLAVMFRQRAEEKELAFTLDAAADFPRYVVADLSKLRQVLINLLGNAVKFTKQGTVVLRVFPAGTDRIVIEVQDTGIGLTPEEIARLFRPFERTRSGEQVAGGTGLGLAISREYAHLLGGEITVHSRVGEGSCFRFEFHAPATAVVPVSSAPARRVIKLAPEQGEIRVLVVDDQPTNRKLLREILEPLGFIIAEACDGAAAVEQARLLSPRIILMDLVMPGMDGIEATKILRKTQELLERRTSNIEHGTSNNQAPGTRNQEPTLTIIGISASAFDTDKQRFLDAGINAFVTKPFREEELFEVLARHAGVGFETETIPLPEPGIPVAQGKPTFDKMPAEWREAFTQALVQGNITRLHRLGEEAKEIDPVLSAYVVEHAELYDLDSLKKTM